MITQRDMDKILGDVNRVFANFEEKLAKAEQRIEVLEKANKPSSTSKASSQEKT